MIDLHAHILPGIDDGALDLDEAVQMCRLAGEDGCQVVVATPHQRHPHWWNCDPAELSTLSRALQDAAPKEPRILSGAEIRVDEGFLTALDAFSENGLLSLAGSRYLLVEFPRNGQGPRPEEIVHEICINGWRPLVAHPELLPWLAGDLGRLEHLVRLGARLQLTAMSLTRGFGRRPFEAAKAMIDAGLAHVLASDMHGAERRPPGLKKAFSVIAEQWDETLAWTLTRDNPQRVLADESIPT
jgi:protein-tyrosine phosphatase